MQAATGENALPNQLIAQEMLLLLVAFEWLAAREKNQIETLGKWYQTTYFVKSKVLQKGSPGRMSVEYSQHFLPSIW